MDIEKTIFLGIIQGLTEVLPISSSGHLVIFQNLIGLKDPELLLDIALHVGTLFAVLIFFRTDIKIMLAESIDFAGKVFRERMPINKIRQSPYAALALWVLLGTIPTAIIGLIINSFSHILFGSARFVGLMLIVTGIILGISRLIPDHIKNKKQIGFISAIAVGLVQGAAVIPGISRSGATIVCGLFFGLDREMAGKFSFLLSVPAIIGASLLKFDIVEIAYIGIIPLLTGILVSFLVGLIALKIMMGMLKKGNLYYFAPYCFMAGILVIFIN
jgi:undecaprenyl-diphosphatase